MMIGARIIALEGFSAWLKVSFITFFIVIQIQIE